MADRGTVVAPVRPLVTTLLGAWTAVDAPTINWTIVMVKPIVPETRPTQGQLWPRANKQ